MEEQKTNNYARSNAEAEYRAVTISITKLLQLILLRDIGIKVQGPLKMFCDNRAAINFANNPMLNDRTKHVETGRHFIKEKIYAKKLFFSYIRSKNQVAYMFIKRLSYGDHEKNVTKLGMFDMYVQLERKC